MSRPKFSIAAGVHLYVEVEFTMSDNNSLREVAELAAGLAASEVGEALKARCNDEGGSALRDWRIRGGGRIDHISVMHSDDAEEGPSTAANMGNKQ